MTRFPRFLPAALPAALLALAACGGGGETTEEPAARAEAAPAPRETPAPAGGSPAATGEARYRQAPDFRLPNVAGGELTLASLKGKVVLLDFWATWCGPCRVGIPHLNDLYAAHKDAGLEIVGISVDQGRGGRSGLETVQAFAKTTPMNYPLVMGDASVVASYGGIRSIPTAFLIDREGRVRKKYVGLQPKAVFEQDVKVLLEESGAESEETI